MHKLSLWQKIGIVGLLLVIAAGLGLGIRYHDHVQADRQHQDRVYQQLDTLEKAKTRLDTEKTASGKLTALLSLIALADTYDRSQDADAKVKHQYQVAIADARKSFAKQDQAKLKELTPEAKTLAKLDDAKLKKQLADLADLKQTVKAHHKAVYSTKAYQALLAKIDAAVKTQTALLKKHQEATKKAAADKKAAAAQASADANSTTDQTDTTSDDTANDDGTSSGNTSGNSTYAGSTYTGSTYGGTSTSRYTGGSRYTGNTWRPSSSSNQSSRAGASTTGSAGTNSNSSAGSASAGSSADNGGTDSSTDSTETTATQPDATTDLSNGSDQ